MFHNLHKKLRVFSCKKIFRSPMESVYQYIILLSYCVCILTVRDNSSIIRHRNWSRTFSIRISIEFQFWFGYCLDIARIGLMSECRERSTRCFILSGIRIIPNKDMSPRILLDIIRDLLTVLFEIFLVLPNPIIELSQVISSYIRSFV